MNALVENVLYAGYGVGPHSIVVVSHLQFVDDTLLVEGLKFGSMLER
jgi:hypothetical protein